MATLGKVAAPMSKILSGTCFVEKSSRQPQATTQELMVMGLRPAWGFGLGVRSLEFYTG